ncbi:hypothetical protein [Nitrospira moscoviensis]|uniref:Uncharacterized protein n=1 Tax=Nitrospira moscoviensis TaxID=42253 RepID=A0A0K2GCH8_NITMO|nr:hypothetical protein [Nitrospira moscoviensis]ALA58666.1 hypothetical protein NITMOv2_2250 [Nitrospira moscoviensis]
MAKTAAITTQVLRAVKRRASCEFDELAAECQEYSWSQIFLEVDRLNRLGELRLTQLGDGRYLLTLPHKAKPRGRKLSPQRAESDT